MEPIDGSEACFSTEAETAAKGFFWGQLQEISEISSQTRASSWRHSDTFGHCRRDVKTYDPSFPREVGG